MRSLLLAAVGILVPVLAGAAPPLRTHDITLDDYFAQATATAVAPSPDGKLVAYTEMRWEKDEDKRNTDLWVVDVRTRERRRLTFDPAADASPQWSPNGAWIYFTSAMKKDGGDKPPANGKTQVWRISPAGGEIFPVTRLADGIRDYQVGAKGKILYYTTGVEHVTEDDFEDLRKEYKKLSYGHGVDTTSELWSLDLESWRAEKLVDERRVVVEFAVSPDERRIAMITRPEEALITNEGWSRVDVYDAVARTTTPLPDRQWRDEAPSPFGWLLGLGWSGDSQVLSFRVDFDGYPGEAFFATLDRDPVRIQKLARPHQVSLEGKMTWMPRTRTFCFGADDHARLRVMAVEDVRDGTQGKAVELTPGDVTVDDFAFAGTAGTLFILTSGLDHPPDVFAVQGPGPRAGYERITRLNPDIDTWKVPPISIVKWTAPDGTPVEGILELPPDYRPEQGPLPLVVAIHGGPTASSKLRFEYWIYGRVFFAARGWACFDPNYRGSTGYGDKFLTDLIGRENDVEVTDILSGVDTLIARGIADPERMAVMGWSNGGYLTNCIITRDQRFKAASSGAGVFDEAMQWAIEDTPGHVINYMKGLPWDQAEQMRESSPLYRANKITTPTLIHVGENDERVPPEQARGLYRALRHYLHVPTELVVYPGEGHGLTQYTHRRAKLEWDQKWFDHHVLGKKEPES